MLMFLKSLIILASSVRLHLPCLATCSYDCKLYICLAIAITCALPCCSKLVSSCYAHLKSPDHQHVNLYMSSKGAISGSPPHKPARPRIIFRRASSSSSSTPYIRKTKKKKNKQNSPPRPWRATAKPRGRDRDLTSWRCGWLASTAYRSPGRMALARESAAPFCPRYFLPFNVRGKSREALFVLLRLDSRDL
jgi:hypothetical protein